LAIAEDDGHAKCLVCNSIFSIKSGGISDVKRHSEDALHRKNINSKTQNKTMSEFLVKTNSFEEQKVIAAKVSFIYDCITHHHSYRSTECGMNLSTKIFTDSNICKKIRCGKTNANSTAQNV
jgi:hypothetical protein